MSADTLRRKPRVQTVNDLPSKTVQADVVRTEIRHILAKYRQVGIIEHLRDVDLQFRDVTEFEDYADMARQTKDAEQVFMGLPSKVREVFGHDVMNWLDAAHDAEKLEALRPRLEKLGVLEPKAPVQPLEMRAGPGKGLPRERRSKPSGGAASGSAAP